MLELRRNKKKYCMVGSGCRPHSETGRFRGKYKIIGQNITRFVQIIYVRKMEH